LIPCCLVLLAVLELSQPILNDMDTGRPSRAVNNRGQMYGQRVSADVQPMGRQRSSTSPIEPLSDSKHGSLEGESSALENWHATCVTTGCERASPLETTPQSSNGKDHEHAKK